MYTCKFEQMTQHLTTITDKDKHSIKKDACDEQSTPPSVEAIVRNSKFHSVVLSHHRFFFFV